jgi:hypothetical protein
MPVGSPPVVLYRYQNAALGALPGSAAETALTNTAVLQADLPGALGQAGPAVQPVKISGVINLLAGTGVTALVIRVRQGVGTAGAVVGAAITHTLAAGSSASIAYSVEDTTGVIQAGTAYTVTLVQTGATGASTINTFDAEVTA